MKFRFKSRKASGIWVSVLAGVAFVWMAVTRFDVPADKVLAFLLMCLLMVVAIVLVAAPVALAIRWWSNRRDRRD